MNITLLLVSILATWRLSSLIANERGAYGWALKLRDNLENYWPDSIRRKDGNKRLARLSRELGMMTNCVWCISRPISFCVAGLMYNILDKSLFNVFLYALAISAGASILSEVIEWLERAHQLS